MRCAKTLLRLGLNFSTQISIPSTRASGRVTVFVSLDGLGFGNIARLPPQPPRNPSLAAALVAHRYCHGLRLLAKERAARGMVFLVEFRHYDSGAWNLNFGKVRKISPPRPRSRLIIYCKNWVSVTRRPKCVVKIRPRGHRVSKVV